MATELGNAIKKVTKKVTTAVKNAFSSVPDKSQTASVAKPTTTSTQNSTPYKGSYAQTVGYTSPKVVTAYTSTGAPYSKVSTANYTPAATSFASNVGYKTTQKSGTTSLNKASAPTDVSKINNSVGIFNLDGGSSFSSQSVGGGTSGTSPMGAGAGVASSTGALKGLETSVDQKIADAQKAEEQAIMNDANQKTTLFDKLLGNEKTPSEVGAETKANLENEYGIKSQIAEINSLTDSLNKVEVEKQTQVAQAQDRLGTNNFINNQVQQIDRNSRPIIDRLKADINFKTGILTQNRELIAEAVTQATAQTRDKWERLKYTYEESKDLIDSLGKVHSEAFKRTIDMAQDEHERNLQLHDWKVEMRLKYGANININDSEQTILEKISRVGGKTISERNSESSSSSKQYTVQSGDEPQFIADKLGLNVDALIAANPGVNWYNLRAGQKISTDTSKTSAPLNNIQLTQELNRQIATPEFKALSGKEKALYIQSQGGTPEDFGY